MPRAIGGIVHGIVDDLAVNSLPENRRRAVNQRFDEYFCVDLIDVILVQNRVVQSTQRCGDLLRKLRLTHIQHVSEKETENSNRDGDCHQQELSGVTGAFRSRFSRRTKHRSKEMLKSVPEAN